MLALANGKELCRQLKKDYKGSSGGWQYSSLLVDGDKVIARSAMRAHVVLYSGGKLPGFRRMVSQPGILRSALHAGGTKQYVTLIWCRRFAADSVGSWRATRQAVRGQYRQHSNRGPAHDPNSFVTDMGRRLC